MESFEAGAELEVVDALGTVRQKTDKSLASERTKTDASFSEEQHAAEMRADHLVAKSRLKMDWEQTEERKTIDARTEEVRSSPDQLDPAAEREIADQTLLQERRASDMAHEHERANADAAIAKERRRVKHAAEVLFAFERGATDVDLSKERRHVDRESALMTVMSSELQDPLSTIVELGTMLQAALVSEKVVSPQVHRLLGLIRKHSSTMETQIAELLEIESREEGL